MSDTYYRSFTFYNYKNNDLSAEYKEKNKKFNTLGYFDKFETDTVKVKDKNGNITELWKHLNEMNKRNTPDISFQNIYGLPCVEASEKKGFCSRVKDSEFWEVNVTAYTYIFVILVQFFSSDSDTIKLNNKREEYRKKFMEHVAINMDDKYYRENLSVNKKRCLTQKQKKYLITEYLTLDRYDYILCVKSNCYLPFVVAMQQLYSLQSEKRNNQYIAVSSFTVTGLCTDCRNTADEIIPSICIKCNYNENNIYSYNISHEDKFNVFCYMEGFMNELKSRLYSGETLEKEEPSSRLYYISGADDIRIIARDVKVTNLIKMFSEDDQIDCQFLNDFSTVINVIHRYNNKEKYEFCKDDNSFVKLREKIDICKANIEEIEQEDNKYPAELTKTLYQILNGLSDIRPLNKGYRGYGFYSLFFAFNSFVEKLRKYNSENKEKEISEEFIGEAFSLTHSFGTALLTTVRSDFKEFQIPTFNANLYYAPIKLMVFYRAFIYLFLDYYKYLYSNTEEYFIINTGNKNKTQVYQSLRKMQIRNENRYFKFFICDMSEKKIYAIKDSMIELSHEICHLGMSKIRNRRKRYFYMKKTFFECYIIYFRIMVIKYIVPKKDFQKFVNDYILSDKFKSEFKYILDKNYNKEVDRNAEGFTSEELYCDETINLIMQGMSDNIDHVENQVLALILNEFQERFTVGEEELFNEVKRLDDLEGYIMRVFSNINKDFFTNKDNKNLLLGSFAYFIEYYYKECFADAIAILSLKLSLSDYARTIREVGGHSSNDDSLSLKYRICIVYKSIINAKEEKSNFEELELGEGFKEQSFIEKGYSEFENNLIDVLNKGFNKDYSKIYNKISDENKNAIQILFYDRSIYNCIVEYISECIKLFVDNFRTKDNEEEFSPSEIYSQIVHNENHFDNILYMDRVLSHFESLCADEI